MSRLLIPLTIGMLLAMPGCSNDTAEATTFIVNYSGVEERSDAVLATLKKSNDRSTLAQAASQNPLVAYDGNNRIAFIGHSKDGDTLRIIDAEPIGPGNPAPGFSVERFCPAPPDNIWNNTFSDLRFEGQTLYVTATRPSGETAQYRVSGPAKDMKYEVATD